MGCSIALSGQRKRLANLGMAQLLFTLPLPCWAYIKSAEEETLDAISSLYPERWETFHLKWTNKLGEISLALTWVSRNIASPHGGDYDFTFRME